MKYYKLLLLSMFGALLIYGASDLPLRGDATNRMHAQESVSGTAVPGNYYISQAYVDAKTPNMVTVILGDYRGIDTLGEEIVIFTAGLVALLLLRGARKP